MKKKAASKSRGLSKTDIYIVFQPIVHLKTRKIFGYEALMRAKPNFRLPEQLFRKAYKEGRITSFDMQSLKISLKVLPKLEKGKYLFLNIEPVTLGESFGRSKAKETFLKVFRPHSKRIVFELTERLKPWDFDYVKKGISFLKKSGSRLALDDVGGVGSELIKLITLKPDFIKIDKDLVKNCPRRPLQQEALKKLVQLAKSKKIKMIAEGVEKKSDCDYVEKLGIQYAQGYYFAKPLKIMHSNLTAYK